MPAISHEGPKDGQQAAFASRHGGVRNRRAADDTDREKSLGGQASSTSAAAGQARSDYRSILRLQATAGNRATAALLTQPRVPSNGGAPPIQRRVGFELETGWILKAPSSVYSGLSKDVPLVQSTSALDAYEDNVYEDDVDEESVGSGRIDQPRGAPSGTSATPEPPPRFWHVSPDMIPPNDKRVRDELGTRITMRPIPGVRGWLGLSEQVVHLPKYTNHGTLEFITAAFEESDEGRELLAGTMEQIVGFAERIANFRAVPPLDRSAIPLALLVKGQTEWAPALQRAPHREDVVVDGRGPAAATFQMTAGIKLDLIPRLFEAFGSASRDKPSLLVRGDRQKIAAKRREFRETVQVAEIRASLAGLEHPRDSVEFRQYVGAVAHVAHTLIMAAKDWREEGRPLDSAKEITALVSRTNFGKLPKWIRNWWKFERDVLFVGDSRPAHESFFKYGGPWNGTVGEWLSGIKAGKDPVNWQQELSDKRWQPQRVGPPEDRGRGHVYEFRSLDDALELDDWKETALTYFDYVRELNKSDRGQASTAAGAGRSDTDEPK